MRPNPVRLRMLKNNVNDERCDDISYEMIHIPILKYCKLYIIYFILHYIVLCITLYYIVFLLYCIAMYNISA